MMELAEPTYESERRMKKDNTGSELPQIILDALLENTTSIVFVKDTNRRYVRASEELARALGLGSEEDMTGKTDEELLGEKLSALYGETDEQVLKNGVLCLDQLEPLSDHGTDNRFSSISKYPLRDENGEIVGLLGIGRDVSARFALEEEKERREQTARLFDYVFEADIDEDQLISSECGRGFERWDPAKKRTFTEAVAELSSRFTQRDYSSEIRERYAPENLKQLYAGGVTEFSHISYINTNSDIYRWVEVTTRLYFSKVSGTLRLTAYLRDADSEVRAREALKLKASTDSLTGLLNRKCGVERISDCIAERGRQHAMLFIDLDNFKKINDERGHPVGDEVLQEISKRLAALFRESDVVARAGGDEFLILLKNVSSRVIIESKAKEIFASLARPCAHGGMLGVTCSIGAVICTGEGQSFDELYKIVDETMYQAKQAGGNCLKFGN